MTGICTRNTGKLSSLSIQFFEMVPVRRIQWQNADIVIGDLDVEAQRYILASTVNSKLCHQYPPSIQYQRAFLKKLLNTLEGCGVEICDELYETYTRLLEHKDLEEESLCYKTYTVDDNVRITIQESVNMISCGTTGLSTWQAAQHLAEWAVQNKKFLENRHILELGCGLGLSGISVCKVCCVNTYTFTDCHTQVLDCLARNIELNFCDRKLATMQCQQIEKTEHEFDINQSETLKCDLTSCDSNTDRSCDTRTCVDCDTQSAPDCDRKNTQSASDCVRSVTQSVTDCDISDTQSASHCVTCNSTADCASSEDCDSINAKADQGLLNDEVRDAWTGVTVFEISKSSCCKRIQAVHLDWENVDHNLFEQLLYTDVILAADVVYDTRIIPGLVSVLKIFLSNKATHSMAYIASTIRNEDTRDQFLVTLSNEGLQYEHVDPPTLRLFHYDRSLPIEIIQVTATV